MCFRRLRVSVSVQKNRNIRENNTAAYCLCYTEERDPTSVSVVANNCIPSGAEGRRAASSRVELAWSLLITFFLPPGLWLVFFYSGCLLNKCTSEAGPWAAVVANAVSLGSRCWTRPCWTRSAELQKARGLLHY